MADGVQLFSMFGKILLQDDGVESKLKSITQQGQNMSTGLNSAFDKVKGAALKLGAVLGVGIGLKDIISKASASQQKLAQMDAVLKSTGGAAGMTKQELLDLAAAQGKLTTFSKGANIETENLLLTFTGLGKNVFPDCLKTVNDMSQALGQDTKSSAIQLGKALNDPVQGMSALKRVGVTFNETQQETIKKLQEAGDVEGAQKVMLQELQKEFGGSAEAAGQTFSGQLAILKNQIGGVATSLGSNLIPYLTSFVTKINQHMPQIQAKITSVINAIKPPIEGVFNFISQHSSLVIGILGTLAGTMVTIKTVTMAATAIQTIHNACVIASTLATGGLTAARTALSGMTGATSAATLILNAATVGHTIATGAQTLATGLATAAQKLFNAALNANPIGIVITLVTALVAAIIILWNKNEGFRKFILGMWQSIKTTTSSVINALVTFFTVTIPNSLSVMINWFKSLPAKIVNALSGVISSIGTWVSDMTEKVKTDIPKVISAIVEKFEELPGKALQWGKDLIQGLIDGITSMAGKLKKTVEGVADKIASFLHFSTPDEGPLANYESWMPDFMQGLADGIENNKYLVSNMVKGLASDTRSSIISSISDFGMNASLNSSYNGNKGASGKSLAAVGNTTNTTNTSNYNFTGNIYSNDNGLKKIVNDALLWSIVN